MLTALLNMLTVNLSASCSPTSVVDLHLPRYLRNPRTYDTVVGKLRLTVHIKFRHVPVGRQRYLGCNINFYTKPKLMYWQLHYFVKHLESQNCIIS